jgi:hypothetical protein
MESLSNKVHLLGTGWFEKLLPRPLMAMFTLHQGSSVTAIWPVLMNMDRVCRALECSADADLAHGSQIMANLPSNELKQSGGAVGLTLHVLTCGLGGLSTCACRVVASHLFHEEIDLGQKPWSSGLPDEFKAELESCLLGLMSWLCRK